MTFDEYFAVLSQRTRPYDWQRRLGADEQCCDRLIRIPTGFGKTLGVLAAWLYHRVERNNDGWPRRLVWCLPMRVLVEQTISETAAALGRLQLLWDETSGHQRKVGVHVLMGGADSGEWHLYPEHCAVLIGTQDMLLSRAMNRGYAAPRARWPMEFGLLNHDCLWVMDEIQLMDVGFATSAQLQAFRRDDRAKALRPCQTWWMSATLQQQWLEKSPDTRAIVRELPTTTEIPGGSRAGHLWDDVSKPCSVEEAKDAKALAALVRDKHLARRRGANGPTLVVLNTVERALDVFDALEKFKELKATDLRLVHSRFRPRERKVWRDAFLNREACARPTDRIIVATQVVEAGVDISAELLVTELAPWASLVQRFGRCARWGGTARVVVADFRLTGDKTLPYSETELAGAREAIAELEDASPKALAAFEEQRPELLSKLYPFEPRHLLLRHELDELFDTAPDLSGADIDISRFLRSGDERDLHVFWVEVQKKGSPRSEVKASREALCPVPFLKARDWLCGKESGSTKLPRLKNGIRAWVWGWQDGIWRNAERRDLYPGQTVLIEAGCGGYDMRRGWAPAAAEKVVEAKEIEPSVSELADGAQDDESLSACPYKTIATHGKEAGSLAREIGRALAPTYADLLDLSGRWHDAGKVHEAFNGSIVASDRPARADLAKAPKGAWLSMKSLYPMPDGSRRPGFRHELASVLALFGILQRHAPDHMALLGPWRELLEKSNAGSVRQEHPGAAMVAAPNDLEKEVLALDAARFDLLAYLVCAHHGKLRVAWHTASGDQAASDGMLRIRGVREGDILPPVALPAGDGRLHELPATLVDLSPAAVGLSPRTGASWTERVLGLLSQYGPFALAWLEALLRAADQRASRSSVVDPLLKDDNARHEPAGPDRALAGAPSGGAQTPLPAERSAIHRPLDGDGRGAGGRAVHPGTTRPPHSATRYVETALGILSYQQLAPHLAERAGAVAVAIGQREFAGHAIDEDFILDVHRRICGDLIPAIAGRWRVREVQVGDHRPPHAARVPVLMRDYARDLAERMSHDLTGTDDLLIETLTFAEGRLLYIHPFGDFNGRVTRLLLLELLHRLDLPVVDPAPDPGEETERYFFALSAYDRRDPGPLAAFWRARFAKEPRP